MTIRRAILSGAFLLGAVAAGRGAEGAKGPESDPRDPTVWPNAWSHANSDSWIVEHHDSIRRMNPRLLVINFSNEMPPERIPEMTRELIEAIRESSRYHGYADPDAPAFLNYEVFRIVDLRDPDGKKGNCSKAPVKDDPDLPINADYAAFFGEDFARWIGVRDPEDSSRFLRLDELVDRGYVHEVWFYAKADGVFRCLECVEMKPVYDEDFRRKKGEYRQAGNGGDPDQPWTGRSLRINCINHERGIGCAMENLGHALEGMAHSGCIPYFRRYFYEYASFDLDKRWGLPFNSFYPLWGDDKGIEYPDPHTAIPYDGEKRYRIENYYCVGGNVHFPPNARHHYDMDNTEPVMSTIEAWRIDRDAQGGDRRKPWTNEAIARYAELAPDCMGRWLVYWRQNMPGLDNLQKDDRGRPMKNWWPFLFY